MSTSGLPRAEPRLWASLAEQELAAFNYAVSHDLAASFRHVEGFLGLLLAEFGDGLTERQRAHAAQLGAASTKCRLMLKALLVVSQAQQKTLEPQLQEATSLLQLELMRLNDKISAGGALVTVKPLGKVYGDPELLALAFHHILDNAIKFRRPGETPRVLVEARETATAWRLRVTDSGIGVAPAYRERAFGMFRRLVGEAAYPGVGAGLATCRQIAHRHGGAVMFVDCDEGACLELTLPQPPHRSRPCSTGRSR